MSADTNTTSPAPALERRANPVPINVTPEGLEALKRSEREIATYRRELPRLLEEGEAGRYALIKGDELLSVWDTSRDAIQAACLRFGLEWFVVQRIAPRDPERFALLDSWMESRCQS
jgi:hypothetical protein